LGHGGYRLHFFTGPMRAARNGPISNDVLADWGARIRGWLGLDLLAKSKELKCP